MIRRCHQARPAADLVQQRKGQRLGCWDMSVLKDILLSWNNWSVSRSRCTSGVRSANSAESPEGNEKIWVTCTPNDMLGVDPPQFQRDERSGVVVDRTVAGVAEAIHQHDRRGWCFLADRLRIAAWLSNLVRKLNDI